MVNESFQQCSPGGLDATKGPETQLGNAPMGTACIETLMRVKVPPSTHTPPALSCEDASNTIVYKWFYSSGGGGGGK